MKKLFARIYLILIFILLYAPIVTLVILSFNDSKTRAKWGGWTTRWYVSMFRNSSIMEALGNTLLIALLSAAAATILGLTAALSLSAMGRKKRSVILGIINIPMLNAEIVTGISLMLVFIASGQIASHVGYTTDWGFWTVLAGHITFNLPYVVLSILPKIRQLNHSTYEAALDLGATSRMAFWKVVMPDLMSGVLSGFLLAFTLSLDDFVITHFVKGPGFETLSTKIYTEVRKGIKPEMYALSTLLFVSVLALLLIINMRPGKANKPAGKEIHR